MKIINGLTRIKRKSWLVTAMIIVSCICWNNTSFVYATADTINLGISTNIAPKCKFKTGAVVSFGLYDPLGANLLSPSLAAGSFDVKCTKNTSSTIAMGTGLYASFALGTTRAMSDGFGNYISYEIFSNAARTLLWNALNTLGFTDSGGVSTSIPVYALILPAQNVTAGNYSDTVTMTITY